MAELLPQLFLLTALVLVGPAHLLHFPSELLTLSPSPSPLFQLHLVWAEYCVGL
jgi:hypothetical protein